MATERIGLAWGLEGQLGNEKYFKDETKCVWERREH